MTFSLWACNNGTDTNLQYRAVDKPWYRLGHGIVLAYIAIGWISSLIFTILLRRENARRDKGDRDEIIGKSAGNHANEVNGRYETVDAARREKGDNWSGFRYVV